MTIFKTQYDLMNDEYYLEILGIRVPNAIAVFLVNLGIIDGEEEV